MRARTAALHDTGTGAIGSTVEWSGGGRAVAGLTTARPPRFGYDR
ncbi:hypothetical protein ACFOWZ_05405 [Lentzea rhizosphaerae]|uniref:Uncharacterized protein n=1 Tax=Lentzea rhizosphaerae TaxID=2041025 RepID=A0ABV8BL27_9PSEU